MILRSISLENIRSYSSQKVDFPVGSVLLSGDVGSGKSTVLKAIEFALFGPSKKQLPTESLLRHGKNEGSVELSFIVNDKEVFIKRFLRRGKEGIKQIEGYIIIDGVKSHATHVELKSKVLELLGYSQNFVTKSKDLIYRYTVYTPQEQMKEIILEDVETRLNTLRAVFGVDKYKQIRENIQIYSKDLRGRIKLREGKAEGIIEKGIQVKDKETSLEKARKGHEKLIPLVNEIKEKIVKAKEVLHEFQNKLSQFHLLSKNLASLKASIDAKLEEYQKNSERIIVLQKEIDLIKAKVSNCPLIDEKSVELELVEKQRDLMDIVTGINEVNQQKLFCEDKKAVLQKEIFDIKIPDLKGLNEEKEALAESVQRKELVEKDLMRIEKLIDEYKAKINQSKALRENSKAIQGRVFEIDQCPVCLQKVGLIHKQDIHMKEELKIKQLENIERMLEIKLIRVNDDLVGIKLDRDKIINSEERLKSIKKEFGYIKEKEQLIVTKRELLEENEDRLKAIKKEYLTLKKIDVSSKEKEVLDLKESLSKARERTLLEGSIKDKLDQIGNLKLIQEENKKSIGKNNKEKSELLKEIESVSNAEEMVQAKIRILDKLVVDERLLELQSVSLEKEIEGLIQFIESLNKELKEKERAAQEIKEITELKNWLEDGFSPFISLVERQVLVSVQREFSELFQEWFSILIEDETMQVQLADDFTPIILLNGYETEVENLSGGERTSVALSYRLALNKVVNDLIGTMKTKDFIILDEPTDGFSSEQLDRMRDVLEQLGTRQTIIVSHDPKIETYVSHIIRVRKHEQISKITEN